MARQVLINLALKTYTQAAAENDFLAMLICMGVVNTLENSNNRFYN